MVKMLRVDRRLIHGQIAFSWTAYLNVDCILVANDDAAGDDIRMTTLRLAKPKNTKLIIKSIDDSIAAFKSGKTDKYKIMIVVENVDDAYRLAKEVDDIQVINLGNVKARDDSKPYKGDGNPCFRTNVVWQYSGCNTTNKHFPIRFTKLFCIVDCIYRLFPIKCKQCCYSHYIK